MEQKKKVLVLYNKLFHYRIPIFNLLAEKYDLTVAYSIDSKFNAEEVKFKTIKIPYTKIGKFVMQKGNMSKMCSKYDVVVMYGNIAWLKNTYLTMKKSRSFGVVTWSIGVSASYNHHYDSPSIWNRLRYVIKRGADAIVFYTSYPIQKYLKFGFEREKLFVANNTVEVKPSLNEIKQEKDSILFIGTMYMQKGMLSMLEEYLSAYMMEPQIPDFNLVGGGDDLQTVKDWVKSNNLEHKIHVHGPIYDAEKKQELFAKAYATISPNQAGLSVLESMGYGVPFVTMSNAITGGEIFNIADKENGVLLDSIAQLRDVIVDIHKHPELYICYGESAKHFYDNNRQPKHMAEGLSDAIEYAYKQSHKE